MDVSIDPGALRIENRAPRRRVLAVRVRRSHRSTAKLFCNVRVE